MTKITLEQFIKQFEGKAWDFDNAYGVQCVDLFNFYNEEVVGGPRIGTPVTNGARDLFEVDSSARRAYYDVLSASTAIIAGDVLVYGEPHGRAIENGKQIFYGHVAIAIGDNKIIESNARRGILTSIDNLFTNGLLGILRPRSFIIQNNAQDVEPQPQNKNKHKIVAGDTFWELEERNNWEHGTIQQLNPELNQGSLEIDSYINIPGEAEPIPTITSTYYVITADDTFWGLEDAWGFEHGTLQNLNPDQGTRTLQIGQRIRRS